MARYGVSNSYRSNKEGNQINSKAKKQSGTVKDHKKVRPYVLDVVRALADEIRGTKTITIDDDEDDNSKSKTIVLSDDDSDSDSIILVGDSAKFSEPSASRIDEDNESFITIDETSFFKNDASDSTKTPGIQEGQSLRRRNSVIIEEPPNTQRTVVVKSNNSLEISMSNNKDSLLSHLKKTVPANTNPLSPLVRVRQHSRYFASSPPCPARKTSGKVTKNKNNVNNQKNNISKTVVSKKKTRKSLRKKKQQQDDAQCFWGPAAKSATGVPSRAVNKKPSPFAPVDLDLQNLPLREIVVDGQNVAHGHSGNGSFSAHGIKMVVDYFQKLGHKVVVILPNNCMAFDKDNILQKLEAEKILTLTPSRKIDGKVLQPYDDRFIIQYASDVGGVVVSRDQYRDLMIESPMFKETIVNRLLMYTFIGDRVYFPKDPLGMRGPTLERYLRFDCPIPRPHSNIETVSCPNNYASQHPLQPATQHPLEPPNLLPGPSDNSQRLPYFNASIPPPNIIPIDYIPLT